MATIVFSGGHELPVSEPLESVKQAIGESVQRYGPAKPSGLDGWFFVTPAGSSEQYLVQATVVAYLKP
jgi:hypothetical protein